MMQNYKREISKKSFRLGLYEKAMPHNLLAEQKLTLAKRCGFDYMELSVDESEGKQLRLFDMGLQRDLRVAAANTDMPIRTMCLSGHRKYPLGEDDPRGMEMMYRAIDLAEYLGIRLIQLAGYDTYYHPSTSKSVSLFEENLEKSVAYAATAGVMLGFETMETDFMNTVTKAMTYVNKINSPYLTVYPDIGNVRNATEQYLEDIAYGEGHISAAHLKETKEGVFRDLEYGQGRVDFEGCIRELRRQGVGMFTCEFWYDGVSDPYEYIMRNKNYVQEILFRT